MKRRYPVTVLLLVLCVFTGIAKDDVAQRRADLEHDVAEFHQQVEQLEFARYLARTALLSPEPADHRANASAIQGFLDPAATDENRTGPGLIRWIQEVSTNDQLLMAVWPSKRESFLRNHEQIATYLSLASQVCEEILRKPESNGGADLHLQQLYAYLTVALGTVADPFSLAGLADSDALLPTEIRWLAPGDSVEEAVQAIAPNGVIFLDEGEYLVSDVVIDKSIWLARSPFAKKQVRLIGLRERPVLRLQGEGTDIELSHLTITYGRIGVQMDGGVSSFISDCMIRENRLTGIVASATAIATLVDTQIRSNYTSGIRCQDSSKLFLLNCHISFNGFAGSLSPGQGIRISDQASISIQDSLLVGNRGYVR